MDKKLFLKEEVVNFPETEKMENYGERRRVFPGSLGRIQKTLNEAAIAVFSSISFFDVLSGGVKFQGCYYVDTTTPMAVKMFMKILQLFVIMYEKVRKFGPEIDYMQDPQQHQAYINICAAACVTGHFVKHPKDLSTNINQQVDLTKLPSWLSSLVDSMHFETTEDMEVSIDVKSYDDIMQSRELTRVARIIRFPRPGRPTKRKSAGEGNN